MKKIFTFIASACFSVMLANAAAPASGLVFDGQFIDCGDVTLDAAYSAPAALTVEAWVSYSALGGGYILSNEADGNGGWKLCTEGDKLDFTIGDGTAWVHTTSSVIPEIGKWYHIVGVYDGTSTKLYLDGVMVVENAALANPIAASANKLTMGDGTPWPGRFLRGSLSDVRIWSVARTAEQIAADMNNTLTGTEEGLLVNWKMNEAQGVVVADAAGHIALDVTDGIVWFGTPSGIENAATANVDVTTKGQTLNIVNGSESAINFTLVNLAGVKVLDAAVKAGATFAKATGLNGVFILKGVAEDGSTIISKVVLN